MVRLSSLTLKSAIQAVLSLCFPDDAVLVPVPLITRDRFCLQVENRFVGKQEQLLVCESVQYAADEQWRVGDGPEGNHGFLLIVGESTPAVLLSWIGDRTQSLPKGSMSPSGNVPGFLIPSHWWQSSNILYGFCHSSQKSLLRRHLAACFCRCDFWFLGAGPGEKDSTIGRPMNTLNLCFCSIRISFILPVCDIIDFQKSIFQKVYSSSRLS